MKTLVNAHCWFHTSNEGKRMRSQLLHSVYQKNHKFMTGSKRQILVSAVIVSPNQPSAPQNLTYGMWGRCWRSEFTNEPQGDSTFPVKHLRNEACLDKLHDWLCLPIQGRALHPNLVVSEDLTGAMEQKCWRLVSTNEKWQMHKSFRLCCVMGSAWHSLGLFSDSSPKNSHGFLMPSLTSRNGPSCCCRVLLILKKKLMFWKGKHYLSIFLIISLPDYIKVITMFFASGSISLLCQ